MIDKLKLTIYKQPDVQYLESQGTITEAGRDKFYKYMCQLDRCVVFYRPHKFSDETNFSQPYTSIDINPKYFECFAELFQYLTQIFNCPDLYSDAFNISRIDIAADIQDLSMKSILASLNIKRIRADNFNIYKETIYGGTNPKIRIYDKIKEIKYRLKKKRQVTKYETHLLETKAAWIRFEIAVHSPKMSLQDLITNPASLSAYFDRLEFLWLDGNESHGVLQFVYRLINRKHRTEMEHLRDHDLVETIKGIYISNVLKWFEDREAF